MAAVLEAAPLSRVGSKEGPGTEMAGREVAEGGGLGDVGAGNGEGSGLGLGGCLMLPPPPLGTGEAEVGGGPATGVGEAGLLSFKRVSPS